MIDIAPKALRFARLAAEQQSVFSSDPEIAVIRRQEESFRQMRVQGHFRLYVAISNATAAFCVRVITALLKEPGRRAQSSEWDGNDFAFLESVSSSLRDQLARKRMRKAVLDV